MKYELAFKPRARKDLKGFSTQNAARVVEKIENLAGDVKRLTNFTPEYRLRVGDYRVLFQIEGAARSFIVSFIAVRLTASSSYD